MKRNNPVTRLFQGVLKLLLAIVTIYAVCYALLLALTALMRRKGVNDRVRSLSSRIGKKGDPFIRKIAGTHLGSLYFNLSVLKHIGRKSGREYVTYLSAYPLGDGFVLTLAYGPQVDWCRNIMASGTCTLIWNDQEYKLEKPELLPLRDTWKAYPLSTRLFLLAGGMEQSLWVHQQQETPAQDVPETDQSFHL